MPSTLSRSALSALLLAGAVALTGCGAASAEPAADVAQADSPADVTVEHAQGETVVPFAPKTVVTFDMASLDTLDALGVPVAALPQESVPSYLSEYAGEEYENAGTLFEPDYEAVNALAPDLIIVANRSASAYPELSKIAPTIDLTLDWADYLGSFSDNVETLGEIFGKEDRAAAELAAIDEKIAETKEQVADAGSALVLLTNAGEMTAFGPGSRFGWLHDELGVTPVIEDVEAATHGDPVSNEFVLDANPDWLLVLDRDAAIGTEGGASAEALLDNDLVRQTTAWQEDQVVHLDSETWYVVMSGLSAVSAMVDEIAGSVAS
ncbi:siderophore ABC transporter substrate-binding protein [Naasia sp. SYSU D00057]|uniref:siderophore ABC transporter substrate-binding protein n=1 Tax=Naasia sp. SYSU D00057 TaxID=2817380 RepID=UPI001B31124E|nr:siderophore ABC transporter substrate-binding protein [Naasia sp. SYSU D00057]